MKKQGGAMRVFIWTIGLYLLVGTSNTWAACSESMKERISLLGLTPEQAKTLCPEESDLYPKLESHLPTSVGWTKDSDDVGFIDANISLRYPLAYQEWAHRGCDLFSSGIHALPYFTYTGRFGFYAFTRDSAPVISKSFNPTVFLRWFQPSSVFERDSRQSDAETICRDEKDLAYHNERVRSARKIQKRRMEIAGKTDNQGDEYQSNGTLVSVDRYISYVDIEYGHLSNGQGISDSATLSTFASTLDASLTNQQRMEYAKDYISRGWDYWGIALTKMFENGSSLYIHWHNYVGGKLQQNIEEYPWENPTSNIQRLKQVSGWRMRYATDNFEPDWNYAVTLDTGIDSPLEYNTVRVELVKKLKLLGVPGVLWYQQGRNSDLAQYYQFVRSLGVSFQFTTLGDK